MLALFLKVRRCSARKHWKWTFSITPLSFDAPFSRNPREYPHKPYTARNYNYTIFVYLHSNFRGGLRKMYFETECVPAVQGHPSSSKVTDFGSNRNRVCTLLLVVSCNFGPIFPVSDILQVLFWKQRPHPYSTWILECSLSTRLPMLGLRWAKTPS